MPYEYHPSAGDLPDPSTPIWRFVNLSKYLSLLSTSSLHFSQVTLLKQQDPFEGTLALPNRQFYELMVSNEQFAREFMQLQPDQPFPPNHAQFWSPQTASLQQQIFAATTYVSCWHVSSDESAFLWSNYSSVTDGLAIRSTIGDLCKALESENRAVYIGEIKYIDYRTEVIPGGNAFNAFYYKRKSFAPERELRCCFSHLVEGVGIGPEAPTKNPKGIAIDCDLGSLVQELVVSPFSEKWFADVVSSVNAKFGADFKLSRSSLMDDPLL